MFDVVLTEWEMLEGGRLRGKAWKDTRPETAHAGFTDGEIINTSPVQTIHNKIAVTKSGTKYLLS